MSRFLKNHSVGNNYHLKIQPFVHLKINNHCIFKHYQRLANSPFFVIFTVVYWPEKVRGHSLEV